MCHPVSASVVMGRARGSHPTKLLVLEVQTIPGSCCTSRIFLYFQDLPVYPVHARLDSFQRSQALGTVARCIPQGRIDFRSAGRPSKAASRYPSPGHYRTLISPLRRQTPMIKAQLRGRHCMRKRCRLALASAGEFIPCWRGSRWMGSASQGWASGVRSVVWRVPLHLKPQRLATAGGLRAGGDDVDDVGDGVDDGNADGRRDPRRFSLPGFQASTPCRGYRPYLAAKCVGALG